MADIHFDGMADTFDTAVYGSSRGFIRLEVLWQELRQTIDLETGQRHILDVGGGMGQVALRLARLGHALTLVDPSEEMLAKARAIVEQENLKNVIVICSDAQSLARHLNTSFDLVMCHAVLEWVASPGDVIKALARFVNPDGKLSLMFLNQNVRILKSALRGDFTTYSSPEQARDVEQRAPAASGTDTLSGGRGLATPTVEAWLEKYGLQVSRKAGIRIFHDHITDLEQADLPALLAMEKNFRNVEPFASLGQHTHLLCHHAS